MREWRTHRHNAPERKPSHASYVCICCLCVCPFPCSLVLSSSPSRVLGDLLLGSPAAVEVPPDAGEPDDPLTTPCAVIDYVNGYTL